MTALPVGLSGRRQRRREGKSLLRLRYEPDDASSGELTVSCSANGFAGRGSAWFDPADIRAFGRALVVFPFSREHPPILRGGFYDEVTGLLRDAHVGICVEPHDARGLVRVTVDLATEVRATPERDVAAVCTIRFLVTYNDLAPVGAELASLRGEVATAITLASSA